MFRKQWLAVFCLFGFSLALGGLFPLSAALNVCETLKKSQELHVLESRARIDQARKDILQYAESLNQLHLEIQSFVGQVPGDIEPAVGRAVGLAQALEDVSYRFFDYSDADDRLFQEWSEAQLKCHGEVGVDRLNEWLLADMELLTSTAGYLSGVGAIISGWPSQWRQYVQQKKIFPDSDFEDVRRRGLEMAESEVLLFESSQYVEELFLAAQN